MLLGKKRWRFLPGLFETFVVKLLVQLLIPNTQEKGSNAYIPCPVQPYHDAHCEIPLATCWHWVLGFLGFF